MQSSLFAIYTETSSTCVPLEISEQLSSWIIFMKQWKKALDMEGKEVVVMGDFNLDFLSFHKTDVSSNSQAYRLKPLVDEMFNRVGPYGVKQRVVGVATFLMFAWIKAGINPQHKEMQLPSLRQTIPAKGPSRVWVPCCCSCSYHQQHGVVSVPPALSQPPPALLRDQLPDEDSWILTKPGLWKAFAIIFPPLSLHLRPTLDQDP